MPQLPAIAYGFATTFKIRDLVPCFAGAKIRQSKTQIVAEYGPDRMAVGFDFGAIVFLNIAAEEKARVIGTILSRVARNEPHAPLEEEFQVEVDPSVPTRGQVYFDHVVVPALTPPVVELVALLLAQSVSLDYYEEDMEETLATLDSVTERMSRTGRMTGSARELTRFVARSLATKNQIVAALALLDKPQATWEEESLDLLYRDFRNNLEIEDRFKAIEYKIKTIQDTLELFLDLSQTNRMLLLEATIVVLIVAEILMSLADKL
jgi:uncharacterized Rmd1/YagE family protein